MAIAIKAQGLAKRYRLGVVNHGTLFKDIQSWLARKRGKEDPHSKIGSRTGYSSDEEHWALDDVSFEIEQGSRVGLIGRNGAGKSTLLKILSRITAPTKGWIGIKGRVASLLEVGTGFHPELTGRENIYLNGAIQGMKKKEVSRKFDEIVAFSEVEKFVDTPVKRYSSGMLVRLGFAVAAHLDCEILLADEVLAVGDASFQKKCLGKMEEVSKSQGKTVVFVSHNMSFINSLCTTGILLSSGKVFEQGDIAAVVERYLDSAKRSRYDAGPSDGATRIDSVSIVDADGKTTESARNGSRIGFRVAISSSEPRENVELRIRAYDTQLRPLWAFTNTMYRLPAMNVHGKGEIAVDTTLPMLTGSQLVFDFDLREGGTGRSIDLVEQLVLDVDHGSEEGSLSSYTVWPLFLPVKYGYVGARGSV